MALDERPIDHLSQQAVHMRRRGHAIDAVQGHIVPRPHPGHQLHAQQRRDTKDWL